MNVFLRLLSINRRTDIQHILFQKNNEIQQFIFPLMTCGNLEIICLLLTGLNLRAF